MLRAGGTVEHAARHAEVTRRQLHRWFCQHLGVGPKQLMDLERFQASLQAVQREQGDPVAGYSDQAHQIRAWRRRLGETPGLYARRPRSPMAAYFGAGAPTTTFYLLLLGAGVVMHGTGLFMAARDPGQRHGSDGRGLDPDRHFE